MLTTMHVAKRSSSDQSTPSFRHTIRTYHYITKVTPRVSLTKQPEPLTQFETQLTYMYLRACAVSEPKQSQLMRTLMHCLKST